MNTSAPQPEVKSKVSEEELEAAGRSRRVLPARRALPLGRPGVHAHLARLAGPEHHFLINPSG